MRRKRTEVRFDLVVERLFAEDEGLFFALVCLRSAAGVCVEDCAVAGGVCGSDDCAHTRATAAANAHDAAKRIRLRKCPATLFNYRRKWLPRRETSSSARLRMSS